ncbi:MAG TPA: hypothetical protein VLU43_00195 [Anaeromyxobacteraceae bacterium]|nr:hypothetical protein [Anaeromyxobacteraceae bacterium]
MTRGAATVREAGVELARMLATLGWVTLATALTLAGLDALPGRIAGDTGEVRRAATVDEAERRLGARLYLPGYFPDHLAWPPAAVRVAGGRGGSVLLEVRARAGGEPALEVLEAATAGEPIADALLGDHRVLNISRTTIGTQPATIADVLHGGATWQELSWEVQGRAVALRTRGSVDELYRMARSVRGRP